MTREPNAVAAIGTEWPSEWSDKPISVPNSFFNESIEAKLKSSNLAGYSLTQCRRVTAGHPEENNVSSENLISAKFETPTLARTGLPHAPIFWSKGKWLSSNEATL